MPSSSSGEGAAIADQYEREIGGVPSVVYTPNGDGPFPVLVFIHGGGFVAGSKDGVNPGAIEAARKAYGLHV